MRCANIKEERVLKARVLKLNLLLNENVINTVAGSGSGSGFASGGFSGDNSLAISAELNNPDGISVDIYGNYYISDRANSRIRKVDSNGIIITFAGNGIYGYSGENVPATVAELTYGCYLCIVSDKYLYLADALNRRIRKVSNTDTITTFAGIGIEGYSGDNGPATGAKLGSPTGITFDMWGNIYYADDAYCVIRKIDTIGIITTVAGNGVVGLSGNGGPADSAALQNPVDVTVDSKGNIYFSELGNNDPATDAELNNPAGVAFDKEGNTSGGTAKGG